MFSRFKEKKEKNSGEIKLEVAGYRPLPLMIKSLEVAGEQLSFRRAEEFVYGDWSDEEQKQADDEYLSDDPDVLLAQYGNVMQGISVGRSDSGESSDGEVVKTETELETPPDVKPEA